MTFRHQSEEWWVGGGARVNEACAYDSCSLEEDLIRFEGIRYKQGRMERRERERESLGCKL